MSAMLHADLAEVWIALAAAQPQAMRAEALARATALVADSTRLWTAAPLPPALEPRRAAALAALDVDRARLTDLMRP